MSDNGTAFTGNDSDDINSEQLITDYYNALNVVTQPSLGANDKGLPRRMSVPDSGVINITLARSHHLRAINCALEGADYNSSITREMIYSGSQSGFTQLYNNTKLVAELLGVVADVSFPVCHFPKSLAVLLFDLKADIVIKEKYRRDRKDFTTIMLKDHEFKSEFNDLSGCIAKVSGIKWKSFGTTKHHAFSFYEIIK